MIYFRFLLTFLSITVFIPLTLAADCPTGDPKSFDYIRRNENRCEGMKSDPSSSNSLDLLSISIRNLDRSYGDRVTIEVPQLKNFQQPKVEVNSLSNKYHYQLDNFFLLPIKGGFRFSWNSYVLKTKSILPSSLRGLATYNIGTQPVYVPVIFGKNNNNYEFVFYSESRVKFTSFTIRSPQGKLIHHEQRLNPKSGETIFNWDGSALAAGSYKIDYVAYIERANQSDERIPGKIVFEHNPNWLK